MKGEANLAKVSVEETGNPECAEKLELPQGREAPEPARGSEAAAEKGQKEPEPPQVPPDERTAMVWDFRARGEPFVWGLGGALVIGIVMIIGFIVLILYNGILTFYPKPIDVVRLRDGSVLAGEFVRSDVYRPGPENLAAMPKDVAEMVEKENQGKVSRRLYRIGNYDLYNEDFRWVPEYDITKTENPPSMYFFERLEWGPFVGKIKSLDLNGEVIKGTDLTRGMLDKALADAGQRRTRIYDLERNQMGAVNQRMEHARLALRKVGLSHHEKSPEFLQAKARCEARNAELQAEYDLLAKEAEGIKELDGKFTITLADVGDREKTLILSRIVRCYPANVLTFRDQLAVYFSRWAEFLTQEPREANTEGGVLPAIFGTFCMTVLLALAVAPFGVIAALYLREYAKQGRFVSLVRICVNNLAGVPSIVYGVFGLGFFAYVLGGSIDRLFFPERLPNPTFGTGGLLWASLTLALLTVPVVIVATEEALAAVPQSMREGSLGCGASKWQTIKYIVLPRAMPGIMTGLILAMARGAEEVAPLMLVGVVKLAPELPVDGFFPYIHLERAFMHLGFHIYDVGFQSRNSEAARPMVYVTTFLLIGLVFSMNAASIFIRNRLKKKFFAGHF